MSAKLASKHVMMASGGSPRDVSSVCMVVRRTSCRLDVSGRQSPKSGEFDRFVVFVIQTSCPCQMSRIWACDYLHFG